MRAVFSLIGFLGVVGSWFAHPRPATNVDMMLTLGLVLLAMATFTDPRKT